MYIIIVTLSGCSVAKTAEGNRNENDIATFSDVISSALFSLKKEIGFLPDDADVTIISYDGKISDADLQSIFISGEDVLDKKMAEKGIRKKSKNIFYTYCDLWI